MNWDDLSIRMKAVIIVMGILIVMLMITAGYAAFKAYELEKIKQELVEKHKQELIHMRENHMMRVSQLKAQRDVMSDIIETESMRSEVLEQELHELMESINESDDQINSMDSTALLHELRSIRSENGIF